MLGFEDVSAATIISKLAKVELHALVNGLEVEGNKLRACSPTRGGVVVGGVKAPPEGVNARQLAPVVADERRERGFR